MYSTFTSRNRDLAEKLSRKLQANSIDQKAEQEPSALDYKYRQVAQKLKILKTKNQRNQIQISQDLQKVQDILYTLQRTKNKASDLSVQLSQNIQKLVQMEQSANTEKMTAVRKGMIEDIEKKKKAMKTDAIQVIQQEFQEICKINLADVDKKVTATLAVLEEERSSKEEAAAFLAHTIGEEILKMEQMISQQRQARKTQNQAILELIAEIQDKLQSQIQQQTKIREKAQAYIQSRLEEVCFKIQHKILGN